MQNGILLAASYLFYGWWDVRFLFLIVVSTVVDYSVALIIDSGTISKLQRIKASSFLLVSAILFVVIQYDSLALNFTGFMPVLDIQWGSLLSDSMGLWVFSGSVLLVLVANIIYPYIALLDEVRRRKLFLLLSITSNLTILGFFKYFGFFAESLTAVSEGLFGITPNWWTLDIILPVGISFYTFQTMSYTIDVYRRELKASHQLVEFATYVSFFPQLVAGPIERGKHLLPQFRNLRPSLTWDDCREGSWLIAWGLFKKMVIADGVAVVVNSTFGPYDNLTSGGLVPDDGLRLLVALYAFAIQIYCDFSGYTDIARGVARLMGFNIMLNFRLPYFATSPSSFWQQWHISLSTWLRDYLYIPLGGNRGGNYKTYRNLSLTMLLGGLWHGASWTFVIWGAYHGFLLSIYRALGIRTEKGAYPRWKLVVMGIVMFHLTCIGWLIFRAQNVSTISIFLQSIILSPFGSLEAWIDFKTLIFYSWFLIVFQVLQGITGSLDPMKNWHWFIRLNVWVYVIMSLLVLSTTDSKEFIYFAF
ncbi:MAG: MBOAT family protein [Gammaproteobacteria bacterium]|nr:MBOAT family protein [Gammaproteobacteria bacterium]